MITMEQIEELEMLIAEDSEVSFRTQADEVRKHAPELLAAARKWVELNSLKDTIVLPLKVRPKAFSYSPETGQQFFELEYVKTLEDLAREAMDWMTSGGNVKESELAPAWKRWLKRAEKALKGEG